MKMIVAEIMSYMTFLLIGSVGIYAFTKETNYLLLIGSIGIVTMTILSIVTDIVDKKRKKVI